MKNRNLIRLEGRKFKKRGNKRDFEKRLTLSFMRNLDRIAEILQFWGSFGKRKRNGKRKGRRTFKSCRPLVLTLARPVNVSRNRSKAR